jgi:hypothetical protein
MAASTEGWHESLRPDEQPGGPSDRSFGFTFAAVFAILAALSLWRGGSMSVWWLGIAAVFLIITLIMPALLSPLNRVWALVGKLLHAIVNPLVMAVMFYGVIVPTGLLMRMFGKDPLRRKIDPKLPSYWIVRSPPVDGKLNMKNQF